MILSEPLPVNIVAVGLIRKEDLFLACERKNDDEAGYPIWEFPGGKLEPGEDAEAALRRELEEELGITADIGRKIGDFRHDYPKATTHVIYYHVRAFTGTLTNHVFKTLGWFTAEDLMGLSFQTGARLLIQRITREEILVPRTLHEPEALANPDATPL